MSQLEIETVMTQNVDYMEVAKVVIGVLSLSISVLGIFGNVYTVVLLPQNRNRTGNLLLSLAIFDLIYLICSIGIFSLPAVSTWYKHSVLITILPVV